MMKISRSLLIVGLALFAVGGTAYAQAPSQAGQNDAAQLIHIYRQKNQQLLDIQSKTLKNDPKLSAEMDHFQAELNTSMRKHGYDAEKSQKRVKAMVAKLRSGAKMSDNERMSTIKSYEAEQRKMMKARAAAMQEPKIQKDRKALTDDMIAAMKKQDSRTGQLIKDVNSLRSQIMAAMAARAKASKGKG